MNTLDLLVAGASTETAAIQFVKIFLENSYRQGYICHECVAQFFNNAMWAIGLWEINVSAQDVENNYGEYRWPSGCLQYTFEYDVRVTRCYEDFIYNVCIEMHNRDLLYSAEHPQNFDSMDPFDFLLKLVEYWDNACEQLKDRSCLPLYGLGDTGPTQFDEPLARFDLQFLLGLDSLSKDNSLVLAVYEKLLRKAILGLNYGQSHSYIFVELWKLYKVDYYVYYKYNESLLDLIYTAFCVEGQQETHEVLLRELTILIGKEDEPHEKITAIVSYLIKPYMLEAFCTILKVNTDKSVLSNLLKFLDVLQEKLASAECFTQGFLDSILRLVLRFDRSTLGEQAAQLYQKLATRLQDNEVIFKHVIDMYGCMERSPDNLSYYVAVMCKAFPFMKDLDIYTEILTEMTEWNPMRFVAAHMMLATYRKQMYQLDEFSEEVAEVLMNLHHLLDGISCDITFGIVLRAFEITDFNWITNNLSNGLEIIETFEAYAIHKFMNYNFLTYEVLNNLFVQIMRCVNFTSNSELLENMANTLCNWYLEDAYEIREEIDEVSPSDAVFTYASALTRISILLKNRPVEYKCIEEVHVDMTMRMLTSDFIITLADLTETPLHLYALKAITVSTLLLWENGSIQDTVLETAKVLYEYFSKYLQHLDEYSEIDLEEVKCYYTSFIDLIIKFDHTNPMLSLKFDAGTYNMLVQSLVIALFERNANQTIRDESYFNIIVHPLLYSENKRIMVLKLAELHASPTLIIPGNQLWKLCIYYGLPGHKMNEDLCLLLQTLAAKQSKLFQRIISVILYNLYKRIPPLTETLIKRAIKLYNTFHIIYIDPEECSFFKVQIIVGVIDICRQSLNVLKLEQDRNRLESLAHLHLFLADGSIDCDNGLHYITNELRELATQRFTEKERSVLKLFQDICMLHCTCDTNPKEKK